MNALANDPGDARSLADWGFPARVPRQERADAGLRIAPDDTLLTELRGDLCLERLGRIPWRPAV